MPTPNEILTTVADTFGVTVTDLKTNHHHTPSIDARCAAIWLMRQHGFEFRLIAEAAELALSTVHNSEMRAASRLRNRKSTYFHKTAKAAQRLAHKQPTTA